LLFPIFSTQIQKRENIQPLLLTSGKLIFTLAISVTIGSIFFAENILSLFYDQVHLVSIITFRILIISFIPICAIQIFGTLNTASDNLRFLIIVSIVGIIINVGLNIFMIPYRGAIGTAVTCLVTHTVIAGVQIVYTSRFFHLKTAWKTLIALIILGAGLYFISDVFLKAAHGFLINFCLFVGIAIIFSVILRLIDIKNIIQLIKTRS